MQNSLRQVKVNQDPSFIHLSNKYLLNIAHVSGTTLGTENIELNKIYQVSGFLELTLN